MKGTSLNQGKNLDIFFGRVIVVLSKVSLHNL